MLRYSPTPKNQSCLLSRVLPALDVTCPTPQQDVCTGSVHLLHRLQELQHRDLSS